MAKDQRFVKVYSQGMGTTEIWVDKETGVNYLDMVQACAHCLMRMANR